MPHREKQRLVKLFAKRYHLDTLVETGTYMGDMVAAMRHEFASIYSVELDAALHEKARRRFARDKNVHLYQGDSARVLPEIVRTLKGPALFWLDAHYSGGITARGDDETPIAAELMTILQSGQGHVMLIDDARKFSGDGSYPTVEELRRRIKGTPYTLGVEADVIRICPS